LLEKKPNHESPNVKNMIYSGEWTYPREPTPGSQEEPKDINDNIGCGNQLYSKIIEVVGIRVVGSVILL
jgi:hypothetical protein